MASATMEVTVRIRWWVKWYVRALILFCRTFHVEPDPASVGRWVMRGVYVIAPSRRRRWWRRAPRSEEAIFRQRFGHE